MADDDALPLGKKSTKEAMEIEVDLDTKKPPAGESSVFSASLSTVNLVVGVGILYLPATFVKSGLLIATIMCLIVAFFVWYTASLVIRLGHKLGKYTYEEISMVALGKAGYVALCISCILFCWGGNLAYVLSIKSMIAPHIARWTGWTGQLAETLAVLITVYPILMWLSLKKNLDALAFVSKLKAGVMVFTVLVVLFSLNTDSTNKYQSLTTWERSQFESFFKDHHDSDTKNDDGTDFWEDDLEKLFKHEKVLTTGGHLILARAHITTLLDSVLKKCVTTRSGKPEPDYKWKVYKSLLALYNRECAKARIPPENLEEAQATLAAKTDQKRRQWCEDNMEHKDREQKATVWERLSQHNPYLWNWSGAFLSIGTIMFGFVYHDSAFSVYKQLEAPTVGNWKLTSRYAIGMITAVQVLFAFIVGARFGINCPSNVLTSAYDETPVFDPNSPLTILVQFLFSLVLLLTYPGCILIAREYCESIWSLWAKTRDNVDPNEEDPEPELDENDEPIPGKYEVTRFTQIVIASVLVALTAPLLFSKGAGGTCDLILDLVGGLACGFMAFVLPSLCYWTVYGFTAAPGDKRAFIDKILPPVIFVFGCLGCIFQMFKMADEFGKTTGWYELGLDAKMPEPNE